MFIELLTLASVCINVGYQLPQLMLLRKKSSQSHGDQKKEKQVKSPLNASTILIKTTGLYLACGYFILNEVPLLSWIHQISSIAQDWMMIYYCGQESAQPAQRMLTQLALHFIAVLGLIVLTPITVYGSLCKTCLTLAFKCKTAASMITLKNSSNISPSTYLLSTAGNVCIALLNHQQKQLGQIYLNCVVGISMDIFLIGIAQLYKEKPKQK